MLEPKLRKEVIQPPLWIREKILKKYYLDVQKIGYIDAHIAYDTAMHHAYCQLNPHLKYNGKNKDGSPKLRKMLTRESFEPTHDQFGTPLWVHKLDEEELNSYMTRQEINAKRRAERRPLV
jgi:hypothetical protein